MSDFLVTSIVLSVVLTAGVNLLPLLFPGLAQRRDAAMQRLLRSLAGDDTGSSAPRVRVYFPWRAMLLVSLGLTLLLNLAGRGCAG